MKKKMLITGASRGLGKELVTYFSNQYSITQVSRSSNGRYCGDLTDSDFRKKVIEENCPDVFINNAGLISNDFCKTFSLNTVAAGDLMIGFYKKMASGSHIINVVSSCATSSGYENMSDWRINYHSSKAALKKISENLAHSKKRNVRITSLEPAHINTPMTGGEFETLIEPDSKTMRTQFYPMPPSYLAKVIDWIIGQPVWVNIESLKILNTHNTTEANMPIDIR